MGETWKSVRTGTAENPKSAKMKGLESEHAGVEGGREGRQAGRLAAVQQSGWWWWWWGGAGGAPRLLLRGGTKESTMHNPSAVHTKRDKYTVRVNRGEDLQSKTEL